jgi:hypothetical protein
MGLAQLFSVKEEKARPLTETRMLALCKHVLAINPEGK